MPFITANERQRRIIQLSQAWDVTLPVVPSQPPSSKQQRPPSHRKPGDDQVAEDLLRRRAVEIAQSRPKSLGHAFSLSNLKKGKGWEPAAIVEVLRNWIAQDGSAGVVEALIAQLEATGVDMGTGAVQKPGKLSRRRSTETPLDRTQLVRLAVERNQPDVVQVLLPHADHLTLDACLPVAIRGGNIQIVDMLLSYGGSVSRNDEAQMAFRQACAVQSQADLVGRILQSDGCPSPACTSLSLVDATSAGCLDIVLHLSRSTADGNYGQAQALKAAISMGRRDIALAIVMGNNPPQAPGLDEAFRVLYNHPNLGPNAKLDIAELLLCAGAGGDIVADALKRSCESQFLEMANMLVKYGASIEHERAAALKSAISRDQNDIVNLLLIGDMKLSPSLASECVGCIPKQTPFENRQFLLASLLRRGAGGNPLSECLVDSAHAGDVVSVDLLVKPLHVLDRKTTGSTDSKKAFDFRDSQRHEVASPDFKDGEALRTAVLRRDMGMTRKILSAQPSPDTLSRAFPLTKNLASAERYQMVELFLKGALTGPSLHDALQDAINEDASHRDDALIKLLLSYDADINFDQGRGLQKVVMQRDVGLLSALIQKASPETAAARVSDVMRVTDHKARYDMMNILTRAGASIGTTEMAEALFGSLQEKPVDMSLLRLLLQQGGADVNALDGAILKQAVNNPDPKVLDLVLSNGKLLNGATTLCLTELAPLPSTEGKCWKLKIILAKSTGKEDIDSLLVHEVQALVRHGAENSSYSTLAYLLESGADPNAFKASALCQAVVAASNTICDMILQSRTTPTPSSLDLALPHALRISDAMDRLSFTKKLVQAGATPQEVNRALTHSITAHASDLSLLGVLARAADTTDGEALCLAASRESAEVVKLLLTSSKHTIKIRDAALVSAVEIKSRGVRFSTCRLLLTNGVSSAVASNALLTAAREDDLDLCDALLAHGASVPDTNGRAVIEACRGGSVGILEVLLKSGVEPQKRILEQGFQAATEIRDLNKRAVIFQSLLKRGVSGEVVDAQLQSAARYGEPGEAILRILLVAGADPNYNNGDAVVAATRSAFIGSLELLIGLWDEGEHQKKPSHPTLLGAFKASWKLSRDIRFRVMDGLFKAGLPATDDLHIALDDAVNEEDPEERLVKLLLSHGASPSANGCKTLIDATRNAAPSSLALLLSTELPEESLSTAFCSGFVVDNFASWFTERGLETANLLLKRGVRGIALTEALLLVIRNSPAEQVELADRFVDLFLTHAPDVDYNNGVLLQGAASRANVGWTRRLLACHPSGETLSSGLQGILETSLPQEEAFELFKLFTEYREGDVHIDVMAIQTGSDPVLVRAMTLYPRSKDILQALLDAGYWYDQATQCSLHPDMEPEEVTLLTWAIAQPQKRISTSLIQLLLDRGAKVNVQTQRSGSTPLTLAVQTRRTDVVQALLEDGAEVDVEDYLGRTPLSLATQMGGELAVQMMRTLLAADPSKDDGSLHNAARDLNLPAIKALIQVGHDPDFPSPLHEGRSALAEVCLHGSDIGQVTVEHEKAMQKTMSLLVQSGSDITIKSHGKSMLHLCFDAVDPVTTSRILLKVGMWKHVNRPFNQYTDGKLTYSPTMYVTKVLPPSGIQEQLLALLRANRATDAFYANSGPQPAGAVGLPEDLEAQEKARRARQQRLAEDSEEFAVVVSRQRELAAVDGQLMVQKAQAEDLRRQKLHDQDLAFLHTRAHTEESLAGAAAQRRIAEQRALGAAELEGADMRRRKALEWEGAAHRERVDNERALSAIRVSERDEVERVERRADERLQRRIEGQRKLLDGQERLARTLANGGSANNRRQIGYVTEES